jgi:hypothetical protein
MPSKKKSDSNQNIIWIVIGVILLIAIGITIYFIIKSRKENYIPPYSEEKYEEVTRLHENVVKQVAEKIAKEKEEVHKNIQKAAEYIQLHVGEAVEKANKFLTSVSSILAQSNVSISPVTNLQPHVVHITKSTKEKQKEILEHIKQVAKIIKLETVFNTSDILQSIDTVKAFTDKVHDAFKVYGPKGDFISIAKSLHDDFTDDLKSKIDDVQKEVLKINEKHEEIKKQELEISTGTPHEFKELKEVLAKKEENTKKFFEQIRKLSKDDELSKDKLQKMIEESAKKLLEAPKEVATAVAKHLSVPKNLENYVNGVHNLEYFLPEFFIENYGFWENMKSYGESAIKNISNSVDSAKDGIIKEAISWLIDNSGLVQIINSGTSGFAEIVNDGTRVLKLFSDKFKDWFMRNIHTIGQSLTGMIQTGFNSLVNLANSNWAKLFQFFVEKLNDTKHLIPGIEKVEAVFAREDYEGPEEQEHRNMEKELEIKCIASHLKNIIKTSHKELHGEKHSKKENFEIIDFAIENYEDEEEKKVIKPKNKEAKLRGQKFIEVLENIMGKEKIEQLRKLLGNHINNREILNILTEISQDKKMSDAVKLIRDHQEAELKRDEKK